jgi:hypothetical protein
MILRTGTLTPGGPHTTRDEVLARSYRIGEAVGQATLLLAVVITVLIVWLARKRRLWLDAHRDALLALERRPLGVGLFAGILSIAGVAFLIVFPMVALRCALRGREDERSAADAQPSGEVEGFRGDAAAAELTDLRSLRVAFDESGLFLNDKLVEPRAAIAPDRVMLLEPLAAAIRARQDRREALEVSLTIYTVAISPTMPAAGAASVLLTTERSAGRGMKVSVGAQPLSFLYLSPSPHESYFYLAPARPRGFTLEWQRVVRDMKGSGHACRERSGPVAVSDEQGLAVAAKKLCAKTIDCADHVELGLPPDRTFGEVLPFLTTALSQIRFPYVRFLEDGKVPIPDATLCPDGGSSRTDGP